MANIETRKCPLRVAETFSAGSNSGCGYPMYWTKHVEFEECYREKCAAFNALYGCTKFDFDAKKKYDELMSLLP